MQLAGRTQRRGEGHLGRWEAAVGPGGGRPEHGGGPDAALEAFGAQQRLPDAAQGFEGRGALGEGSVQLAIDGAGLAGLQRDLAAEDHRHALFAQRERGVLGGAGAAEHHQPGVGVEPELGHGDLAVIELDCAAPRLAVHVHQGSAAGEEPAQSRAGGRIGGEGVQLRGAAQPPGGGGERVHAGWAAGFGDHQHGAGAVGGVGAEHGAPADAHEASAVGHGALPGVRISRQLPGQPRQGVVGGQQDGPVGVFVQRGAQQITHLAGEEQRTQRLAEHGGGGVSCAPSRDLGYEVVQQAFGWSRWAGHHVELVVFGANFKGVSGAADDGELDGRHGHLTGLESAWSSVRRGRGAVLRS